MNITRYASSPIRHLDFDDLLVMSLLPSGIPFKDIAKMLNITPPAISFKIKKIESVWPGFKVVQDKNQKTRHLDDATLRACEKASSILEALI